MNRSGNWILVAAVSGAILMTCGARAEDTSKLPFMNPRLPAAQRAADLVHGLVRRLSRGHAEPQVALYVLDHDDGVIDPRETRPLLCAWARRAHEVVAHEAGGGPKARGPRP